MPETEVVTCPKCGQKLRLPRNVGSVKASCPVCRQEFFWNQRHGVTSILPQKKMPIGPIAIGLTVIAIGLWLIIGGLGDKKEAPISSAKVVSIDYRALLDPTAITRTGERLMVALRDRHQRGAVQPFVDGYSRLLNSALEIIEGPPQIPFHDIIDFYPAGAAAPAWVAIFRGGRIRMLTDLEGRVRVFLIGKDPRSAWESHYSIIRHSLNELAAVLGTPLSISVYAYENDYAKSEMRLHMIPLVLERDMFSSDKVPLPLAGLKELFDRNAGIVGGQIHRRNGLILFGEPGRPLTLAGAPASLSDLAVAYRAVFHAGDNEAFISLDPHKDPTKVNCNFGGFLEDTRIGHVVLAADKRFKTISTGLDPNSFADIRAYTRRHVPAFMTGAERSLLSRDMKSGQGWVGTRFWFYPESITVDSDLSYEYAVITKARFTADAERSRDDFQSPEQFEALKQQMLSPSIRQNIDHLNREYELFSAAFEELRELDSVARLMGICTWLHRAAPDWLDLDALLSVQVPAFRTPKESDQLISVVHISLPRSGPVDRNKVIRDSDVVYLSNVLNLMVPDYFGSPRNIATFLCLRDKLPPEKVARTHLIQGQSIFERHSADPVRLLIKTEDDLKALVEYADHVLPAPLTEARRTAMLHVEKDMARIEALSKALELLERRMNNVSISEHNRLVPEYNRLVAEHEAIRTNLLHIADYDDVYVASILGIGGGINLESRHFNIRRARNSPAVETFRNSIAAGNFVRSGSRIDLPDRASGIPTASWRRIVYEHGDGRSHLSRGHLNYWQRLYETEGEWRDSYVMQDGRVRERTFSSSTKVLNEGSYSPEGMMETLTGQLESPSRIVFRHSTRDDLLIPRMPPAWWSAN